MTKRKLGRPPDPERKNKRPTWVMLTNEQRQVIMDDFGGYQRGLETLVKEYMRRAVNL